MEYVTSFIVDTLLFNFFSMDNCMFRNYLKSLEYNSFFLIYKMFNTISLDILIYISHNTLFRISHNTLFRIFQEKFTNLKLCLKKSYSK